jgi:hypothetical protein
MTEALGSIKRFGIVGDPDRAPGKPMVEGGDRHRVILSIVVGKQ